MEGAYESVAVAPVAVLAVVEWPSWMPRCAALSMYAAACLGLSFIISAASSANLLVAANVWVQGPEALPGTDVQRGSRAARAYAFYEIPTALGCFFVTFFLSLVTRRSKDGDDVAARIFLFWFLFTCICSFFASCANLCWANYSLSKLHDVSAPSAEDSLRLGQLRAAQLAGPAGETIGLLDKQSEPPAFASL